MWYGHTSCAMGCQYMDSIIESDLQRFVAGEQGGYRREVEVMEDDPL